MRLVNIVAPITQFDSIAELIIKKECFQPENIKNVLFGYKKLSLFGDDNPYRQIIKKINDFYAYAQVSDDEFFSVNKNDITLNLTEINIKINEYVENLTLIDEKLQEISREIVDQKQIIRQILPILNIDTQLDDFFNLEFVKFRFGRMTSDGYKRLELLTQDQTFVFFPVEFEDDYVWGMYFSSLSNIEYVDNLFAALYFERVRISGKITGTPKEAYERANRLLLEKEAEQKSLLEQRIKNINECINYINPLYFDIKLKFDSQELKKYAGHSENNFYLSGWVSSKETKSLRTELEKSETIWVDEQDVGLFRHKSMSSNLDFDKSNIIIPTKLKNFSLFKPFETFVRMYGIPSYNEFDPTPLVAITYTLLFGIMFGDLGQGLVIALIGLFLSLVKKMEFGKILVSVGISSAIFGCIYDSVFGFEGVIKTNIFGNQDSPIHFSPSHDVNVTLFLAIGLGVCLIGVAIILNIINGIRQKNIEKIFFSYNGLAGLVMYFAIIFAVVNMLLLNNPDVLTTLYIVLFIVIPVVFIFFRHPLTSLIKRNGKIFHNGIGNFFLESIFEMLEVMLSFVTNTVSFMRIGAFALIHAGMMLVVFILANTVPEAAFGSGNIVVLIFGNIFVMALEGLIVGIQVLRLEFYEMFGRFFAGDGKEFIPAKMNKK